ncbi:MAG: hypothetical protein ACPGGG_04085 [Parvibaculales bacterium]
MKKTKKPRDAEVDILPPENAATTDESAAQDRLRMPPVIEHNSFLQKVKQFWTARAGARVNQTVNKAANKAADITGNLGANIGDGASRAGRHIAGWPHHIWDFARAFTYRLVVLLLICASLGLVGYGIWHNRGDIDTTAPNLPLAEIEAVLTRAKAVGAAMITRLTSPSAPTTSPDSLPDTAQAYAPEFEAPKVEAPQAGTPQASTPKASEEAANDILASVSPMADASATTSNTASNTGPDTGPKTGPDTYTAPAISDAEASATDRLIAEADPPPDPPAAPPAALDNMPETARLPMQLALPALLLRVESGAPYMLELARAQQSGALTRAEYDRLYAYAGFGVTSAANLQHAYIGLRDNLLNAAQSRPPPPLWLDWLARNSQGLVQLRARGDQPESLGLAQLDILVAQQEFAAVLTALDRLTMREDIAAAQPEMRRWRADLQAHLYVAPLLADLRRRILDADHAGPAMPGGTERQKL